MRSPRRHRTADLRNRRKSPEPPIFLRRTTAVIVRVRNWSSTAAGPPNRGTGPVQLDDTIVLITGAAGGIGRAVSRSLKDAGATVIATDLAAEAHLPAADVYYRHDVTSEADWARIAGEIRAKYGRLDCLIN